MSEGKTKKGGRRSKPPAGTAPREAPKGQVPQDTLTFGEFIRNKRMEMYPELSLRRFAKEVMISPQYLSKVELGRVPPPSVQIVLRLANKLRVDQRCMLILAGHPSLYDQKYDKNIKDKALAVISVIATPDIKLDDDHKLEEIYAIAHAALGECPNPHKDDIEAIEIAYKQFKETGLL